MTSTNSYQTSGPSIATPRTTAPVAIRSQTKYQNLTFCKSALIDTSSAWTIRDTSSGGNPWGIYIEVVTTPNTMKLFGHGTVPLSSSLLDLKDL